MIPIVAGLVFLAAALLLAGLVGLDVPPVDDDDRTDWSSDA